MKFISYAQNYEDVMLWRALKHIKNGFYVDVGAAWPDEDSVTKAFYENGWQGINIEPNSEHYETLIRQRPRDINLKVAVADSVGRLVMNFVPNTGLSTAIEEFAEQHKSFGWTTNRQEVSQTTLKIILSEYIQKNQPIHFLKVDVEGLEDAVLRGNDWEAYRPWIVVVEATVPMSQNEAFDRWEPVLLKAEYLFAYADGLNRFYVASEHKGLLDAFKFPPNVFDGFLLHSQNQSEIRAKEAEASLQKSEAQAKKFEIRAQQSEVREYSYKAQLQEIYESKFWRASAPLRWVIRQTKRLYKEGVTSRFKALINRVLNKINRELMLRPATRGKVLIWIKRLGLYSWLRKLIIKLNGQGPTVSINTKAMSKDLQDLSPNAKKIYVSLKKSIERHRKVED